MASVRKMEALSASLRANMTEDVSDIKRTPSPSPPKRDTGRTRATSGMRKSRGGSADGQPSVDHSQLAFDYDEIRARYEDVLKENESLRADAKRRLESYTRREKKYQDEVEVRLAVREKRPSAITYDFLFTRVAPGERATVARGSLTAVCVSREPGDERMRAVPMPEDVARLVEIAPPELLDETD